VITFVGVWKSYGETVALRDASFQVERGQATLLTGPSGAGKSTLLRILFAAEHIDRGHADIAGYDLTRLRRATVPQLRRTVGVVFQDFKLLGHRSVRENVGVALEIRGVPERDVRLRVDAALAAVGMLPRGDMPAERLSGGEQQRVAVARAVVGDPEVVLADEPTGNLDPERSRELLTLFEALRVRGTTILMATHDPEVIRFGLASSWRRIRLAAGSVVDVPDDAVSGPTVDGKGNLVQLEAATLRKLLEAG
jgi:cell division transport system ATP-binding protein